MKAQISQERFRDLVVELIDENPFAIRPVLKILDVVFTDSVPTLAVTCEDRPVLKVNLGFLRAHCLTDEHVKAVVCHEFLHVVLRHTESGRGPFTAARHLALDAAINAIIHRQFGEAYSSMMKTYYRDSQDLKKMLRPMNLDENAWWTHYRAYGKELPQWVSAWAGLYGGKLVADDIEAVAEDLKAPDEAWPLVFRCGLPAGIGDLLGDHEGLERELPEALRRAVGAALRQMNGAGIWRSPRERGVGANPYECLFTARNELMRRWERRTLQVLRRHLTPDRNPRRARPAPDEYRIPVLSPGDRRAFVRAMWAPFLPEAVWPAERPRAQGTAQVYLDVSGSMSSDMQAVIALLARLSRYIRRPFWAFSDEVVPAVIESGGVLKTRTTGGTSMTCVLEHVAKTRPEAAVVLTDGYIERVDAGLLRKAKGSRLHVLVTRDGDPSEIDRAGLPYTQLDKVPS